VPNYLVPKPVNDLLLLVELERFAEIEQKFSPEELIALLASKSERVMFFTIY
jgi:hypothetical protein